MPAKLKPIEVGDQYGPWVVVLVARENVYGRREFRVRCSVCNRERVMGAGSLFSARNRQVKHCIKCYQGPIKHDVPPSLYCTRCYGITDRRPRVGLCRCGESFREEVIPQPDVMRSSAGWDNIESGGRVPCATVFESRRVAT
jgi:hypothetical protein